MSCAPGAHRPAWHCPHHDALCELGDEQERSGDLPWAHIPDPRRKGNVDTQEARHSLRLPPAGGCSLGKLAV